MSLDQLIAILNSPVAVAVILVAILVGGHRKVWVFGWLYSEKAKSEEEWKDRAWRQAQTTDKALDVAKQKGPK